MHIILLYYYYFIHIHSWLRYEIEGNPTTTKNNCIKQEKSKKFEKKKYLYWENSTI